MQQRCSIKRIWPTIPRCNGYDLVGALLITLIIGACSFEAPQAPTWDTTLTIPLISRYYTMQDLMEDEPNLSSDSAGQMHYLYDIQLDSFRVGNQLTFEDFSDSYSILIGQISFSSPGSANLIFTLAEIYPQAALLNGQTVMVPAFNFDLGKRALSAYADFDWIEVATGAIRLQLHNNLAVPLGSPLHFALYDTHADTLVVGADYNGAVEPDGTLDQSIDLSGKKFSNELSMEISGNSPGSRNQPVLIDAASSLSVNAGISDLRLISARGRIGSQEIADSDAALIDQSVSAGSAKIKQGLVRVEMSSQLPIPATMVMTLPDFIRPDGSTVVERFTLNAAGATSRVLDVSGYGFSPQAAPLGQQTVKLLWAAQSPGSGGNYVTVQSADEVRVSFSIANAIFSEFSGTLAGRTVGIDPESYAIDVPEDIDSVYFDNAQLELRLRNGIGFPAQIDFLLEGTNEVGRRVEMRVRDAIRPGNVDGSAIETSIVLNRNNSNVIEFLNALPTSIRVSGAAIIGGAGFVGRARETDAVTGLARIDAPLSFSLPAQRIEMDSEPLDIDDEVREEIRDHVRDGALSARIANHLPMGASLFFYFGRSEASVFSSPVLVIGPAVVQAPALQNGSGLVQAPRLSEVNISLSEQQLKVFSTEPLFAGVLVDLPGTNGQIVRVIRSDYLDIKAAATINLTVDPESGN